MITLKLTFAELKSLFLISSDTPIILKFAVVVAKVLSPNSVFEIKFGVTPAATATSALLNTSVCADAPLLSDWISYTWCGLSVINALISVAALLPLRLLANVGLLVVASVKNTP